MDCQQLIRLVKEWGLQVKQETMAIDRMKIFVDQHVKKCPVCAKDLIMPDELEKIYEFLVPGSSRGMLAAQEASENTDVEDDERQDGEEVDEFADDGLDDEPVEDEDDEI